jgi:hypothetical protein
VQHEKFTIKIAFSMTISNAQNQTLKRAEMYLPLCIFPHGQLCVAFSGSSSFDKVTPAVFDGRPQLRENDRLITSNTVYRKVKSKGKAVPLQA